MAKKDETKETATSECHHGVQMTDEELEEHFRAFQEIEECIEGLKGEKE